MRAALSGQPGATVAPPCDEAELMQRVRALAGMTVGELGAALGVEVPADQRRAKGLVGQLMERALGCDAASRAEPDFTGLGIELKTIPLDRAGKPRESTFLCSIHLTDVGERDWNDSRAFKKLRRVLWVPVESEPGLPLPTRRIGVALLWSPSDEQQAALRADWEELAGIVGRGDVEAITAHVGQCLQVRPKAAHSGVRKKGRDAEGGPLSVLPRGFYLRARFTAALFT